MSTKVSNLPKSQNNFFLLRNRLDHITEVILELSAVFFVCSQTNKKNNPVNSAGSMTPEEVLQAVLKEEDTRKMQQLKPMKLMRIVKRLKKNSKQSEWKLLILQMKSWKQQVKVSYRNFHGVRFLVCLSDADPKDLFVQICKRKDLSLFPVFQKLAAKSDEWRRILTESGDETEELSEPEDDNELCDNPSIAARRWSQL